jgi:outer membrane protein assembly factor BamB
LLSISLLKNYYSKVDTLKLFQILTALFLLATPTLADPNFEHNADGLKISKFKGRTIIGVTRGDSKVFSVYLDRNKQAKFHFSSGKRKTVTWRQVSRNIICFKGLVDARKNEEVCKYANPLGRGTDWMTVKVFEKSSGITYDKVTKNERRGSSQIVYTFAGDQEIAKNSYISDLRKWKGHTVVGRTIKDKEAWFMQLGLDNKMEFVFGSGKRFKGSYTTTQSEICLKFFDKPAFDGCRKPTRKNGKMAWVSTASNGHTSEIVFMKETEKPGPKIVSSLSDDKYHMVLADPLHRTIAAVSRAKSGSVEIYDSHTQRFLAKIPHYARDLAFSPMGLRLAGNYKNKLWQANVTTGQVDWAVTLDPEITLTEMAYALDKRRILVGSDTGHLYVFDAADGKQLAKHFIADSSISDVAVKKAQVLVGNQAGQLFAAHYNNLAQFTNFHTATSDITITRLLNQGQEFLALTKTGTVLKGTLGALSSQMAVTNTAETGISPAYSLAVNSGESEIIVSYNNGIKLLKTNALENIKIDVNDELPKLGSTVYLSRSGGFISVIKDGGLKVWARSAAKVAGVKSGHKIGGETARKRWIKVRDANLEKERIYKALKSESDLLYATGKCTAYSTKSAELPANDRKSGCEQAAIERKQTAKYNQMLTNFECQAAADFRALAKVGSEFREKKCFATVQTKAERAQYDAAKSTLDCATITQFEAQFNEVGAGDECTFQQALTADSARKLYFAAVKMDTAKRNDRAKQLYLEVMNRFPDDDLAIDSAKRLTELGDQEERNDKDAKNAAALKAAQTALEQAKRANEAELRKAREREAAAKRDADNARVRAAEARAREAEARAKANRQPTRNTACDHVTVGQRFSIKGGGFFGIGDATYIVIGISRSGGVVTGRMPGTDIQNQFRCSRVR